MFKFKEGDRVRVVCSTAGGDVTYMHGAEGCYNCYLVGAVGTILRKEGANYRVELDEEHRQHDVRRDLCIDADELAALSLSAVEKMFT